MENNKTTSILGSFVEKHIKLMEKYRDKKIHSIQEYMEWVDDVTQKGNLLNVYFRGQENKDWKIIPSLFREVGKENDTDRGFPLDEQELLNKSKLQLWNEFSSLHNYLDKLAFLQHHGMATRLLDVTTNPLIALYFACLNSSKGENNGAVYCGNNCKENIRIAELTAEFIFNRTMHDNYFKEDFDLFFEKKNLSQSERSYFHNSIFIRPPFSNQRIERQSSAFILAPLFETDDEYRNTQSLNKEFLNSHAIIPNKCKEKIIKDLHRYNIDNGSIMQSVETKINSIIQECFWSKEKVMDIVL